MITFYTRHSIKNLSIRISQQRFPINRRRKFARTSSLSSHAFHSRINLPKRSPFHPFIRSTRRNNSLLQIPRRYRISIRFDTSFDFIV